MGAMKEFLLNSRIPVFRAQPGYLTGPALNWKEDACLPGRRLASADPVCTAGLR
jgi:hypothetical protein